MKSTLILENGSIYEGFSFGYEGSVSGEVVFSTNMTGYPESLTDPSFCKQILCLTYPLVGNYGVPSVTKKDTHGILENLESSRIWVNALLVGDYSKQNSHYLSELSLSDWLKDNKVVGLHGIDTRRLTKELRDNGSLKGKIIFNDINTDFCDIHKENLVGIVSTKKPYTLGKGDIHIGVIDCGIKYNIIRNLIKEGFKITILPYEHDFVEEDYDGIFISNGPGDPCQCIKTIENIKKYIELKDAKPLFGICLGNQLLAKAAGGKTYKMKYGNRGFNQPVYIKKYDKTYITSQNHGYAVDKSSLSNDWEELCFNKNDQSNEGIYHTKKPFMSVQFHPEARGGPCDTIFMFKDFYNQCCDYKYGNIENNKIILLGSGGLNIGQAGEFDYSGSQAIKSFKKRGFSVILVNPNIATIQTTEGFADQVYYVPVEKEFVRDIIVKERPRFISLSFGGQTALNCGIELFNDGILYQYNVEVLGTSIDNILKTEDRDLFSKAMTIIGEETPKSQPASNLEDAKKVAKQIGYPVLVRAAFALGGLGSGFCHSENELVDLVSKTFTKTNQVLIDQDLRGWKEVEYEVMRDKFGNSIIICNMENFDPLGIHTGDSIVVAPSQTLSNDEYNMLRSASLKIAKYLGIIGECNVQIALDPYSKKYKIIEVNPRLSRSSALASKATGYPIASVAAQLCLGEKLYDILNVVTGNTTANFEPSLDYLVVKIPRWDTRKFPGVDRKLGSAMRSVGEIMAIGRNFEEAFQKGLRMVGGFGFEKHGNVPSQEDIMKELKNPTDDRIRILTHAILDNFSDLEYIHEHSKIDRWFLSKLFNIKSVYNKIKECQQIKNLTPQLLLESKINGFSDEYISNILQCKSFSIWKMREQYGVTQKVKQIDTLAGEFPTKTNYVYNTYLGDVNDIDFNSSKKKIIILGSGKYRIGSSVEFDYCSVKCAEYLRNEGFETIMINYNPETMSTDFDNSDKLYFEELTFESVYDIYMKEKAYGVIVSVGGQEPNNIAIKLHNAGLNILGTSPESIDLCENRSKYSTMLDKLRINQPNWLAAENIEDINLFITDNNFPLLVRPSYVLSGAAMRIVNNKEELELCLKEASDISPEHPIVLTKFFQNCREVDLDAVANNGNIITYAISEHVENAGVHSGDATLVLPSYSISEENKQLMIEIVKKIGKKLNVSGLYNTQFLVNDNWVGVIETNLRASRSVPFVSKTLDIDFIKLAVHSMIGKRTDYIGTRNIGYYGVKCPQFSFDRLPESDPILGVEMSSTGEVACFGKTLEEAYLKSLIASRCKIKTKSRQNILVLDQSDTYILESKGHNIIRDTTNIIWSNIDMVIDCSNSSLTKKIRRLSIDYSKYLITNQQQLQLLSKSIDKCLSIQPYLFYKNSLYQREIKLFVRQGFTESDENMKIKLQKAISSLANYHTQDKTFNLLTGNQAESKSTFKKNFELNEGIDFTPNNFRDHRISKLEKADAMIIFRTGLSESTVFEVAYNIFKGNNIPVFYAIEPGCEIKTTLLRELDGYCNSKVSYKVIENGIDNILDDEVFIDFMNKL